MKCKRCGKKVHSIPKTHSWEKQERAYCHYMGVGHGVRKINPPFRGSPIRGYGTSFVCSSTRRKGKLIADELLKKTMTKATCQSACQMVWEDKLLSEKQMRVWVDSWAQSNKQIPCKHRWKYEPD